MNRPWPGCAGLILLLLSACANDQNRLERIRAGEPLRVAIPASASFSFADASLIRGLERYIISAYVATHESGAATLLVLSAISSRPMSPPADPRIATSAAYAEGEWVVVGGRGQRLPERLQDIPTGALAVAKDSPAVAVLQRLKEHKLLLQWQLARRLSRY